MPSISTNISICSGIRSKANLWHIMMHDWCKPNFTHREETETETRKMRSLGLRSLHPSVLTSNQMVSSTFVEWMLCFQPCRTDIINVFLALFLMCALVCSMLAFIALSEDYTFSSLSNDFELTQRTLLLRCHCESDSNVPRCTPSAHHLSLN